jgi:hypothetical protein
MSFNIKKQKVSKKVKKIVFKGIEELHEEYMEKFKRDNDQDSENNYLLDVSKILQDYFFNIDNKEIVKELTEKYYKTLNLEYPHEIKNINNVFCEKCNTEKLETNERFLTCTTCGEIDNEKILDGLNYQDECQVGQIFTFDYKRINYFTEWLNQIQANETTIIPDELLEDIKIELYKKNIIDTTKLTPPRLKKILKEIDRTKYYEHIPLLISKLSGSKPLNIPENICSELKNMFLLVQQPFEKLKGNRSSFLSYPYILYKFCEILGLHSYLSHFSLLKSREKLMKADNLWKAIVKDIYKTTRDPKWVYIPSC